uniref:MTM1037 n=1 Tax=Volvox carteri f. nagariensis TaxID=3068 RepID=D9CJ95_VOLCA|nr:MTM1037 [Volvox carteri f. nagariensis]
MEQRRRIPAVNAAAPRDRRLETPPTVMALLGLGIASVTAVVTMTVMKARSRPGVKVPSAKGKGLQASARPTVSTNRDFAIVAPSNPAASAEGMITRRTPIMDGKVEASSMDPTSQCSSSAEERGCNYDDERVVCETGPLPSLRSAVSTAKGGVIVQQFRSIHNSSVLVQVQQENQRQEKPEGQPPKDCILDQIQPKGASRMAPLKVLYGQLPQQSVTHSVPTPAASNVIGAVFLPNVETVLTNQHSAANGVELVRAALIPTDSLESSAVDLAGMEAAQALFRAEVEAEHLLLDATAAWHVQGSRVQGIIMARRALEALRSGPHRAKYRSEVASSLADMLHAMNLWDEALDAVDEALQAAQQAGEWALAVKLSNNMGALYKELGRVFDAEALHRSCYSMAVEELGIAHPLSLLTRANLIEALMVRKAWEPAGSLNVKVADQEQQDQEIDSKEGKVDCREARHLLQAALSQLKAEAEILKVAAANSSTAAGNVVEGLTPNDDLSSDQGKLAAIAVYHRACIATVRTYIELGRLEMEAGEDLAAAEDAYRAAVELCDEVYGADSRESQGTASSLANCLRAAGKKEEARILYERLYDLTFKRNGRGEATAVHLAQSLADLAEEAGDWATVDKYSSAALDSMMQLIGTNSHRVLDSFYQAACRAKAQNGDTAGADALRRMYLTTVYRFGQ